MSTATLTYEPKAKPIELQWRSLADLALRGLTLTYGFRDCPLPHTCRWHAGRATAEGHNPRYALIALLGLAKAQKLIGPQPELCRVIWDRIADSVPRWQMSVGDFGLALWANLLHGDGRIGFTVERALRAFKERGRKVDSVDLAWLLLGAEHTLIRLGDSVPVKELIERARDRLMNLFCARSRLFFRHDGASLGGSFTRRVPCFANQIYPVMALGVHGRRTACPRVMNVLREVTDELCLRQGPDGQWCWLYDARDGGVVDAYPVFSVHQDGMAPMALMEASAALHHSFQEPIHRGLQWIYGKNEANQSLVLEDAGLVLRDIHRRGVERIGRAARAFLWCLGVNRREDVWTGTPDFILNAECRPYHLGWILYAAGLACDESRMYTAD